MNKQERFTALLHHVTVGLLRDSFYGLQRKAAPGVDGVTWKEYETGLEDRLNDLHGRVHRGAYRALPSKRKYLQQLREHLRQYGLEVNEDKTRLIRFGRFARQNREERGEGKPEAFTFLGFRHVCAENRLGRFDIRRITDGERRRKKLQAVKQELRRRMHDPVERTGQWLKSVLNGYYQYHAVPGNLTALKRFQRQVARYWFHALAQRSQRRPTWDRLGPLFDRWLPAPTVVHDFPDARFRASRPLAAHPK